MDVTFFGAQRGANERSQSRTGRKSRNGSEKCSRRASSKCKHRSLTETGKTVCRETVRKYTKMSNKPFKNSCCVWSQTRRLKASLSAACQKAAGVSHREPNFGRGWEPPPQFHDKTPERGEARTKFAVGKQRAKFRGLAEGRSWEGKKKRKTNDEST